MSSRADSLQVFAGPPPSQPRTMAELSAERLGSLCNSLGPRGLTYLEGLPWTLKQRVAKYLDGALLQEFVVSLGCLHDAVRAMEPGEAQLLVVHYHRLLQFSSAPIDVLQYLNKDLGQLRRRVWDLQHYQPATHPLLLWYTGSTDYPDYEEPVQARRLHLSLDQELFDFFKIFRDHCRHRYTRWDPLTFPLATFGLAAVPVDPAIHLSENSAGPQTFQEWPRSCHKYHALFCLLRGARVAARKGDPQVSLLLLLNILHQPKRFGCNPVRPEMWALLADVFSQCYLWPELALHCSRRAALIASLPSQIWTAHLSRQMLAGRYGRAEEEAKIFDELVAVLPQPTRLYHATWMIHLEAVLERTEDIFLFCYAAGTAAGGPAVTEQLNVLRLVSGRIGKVQNDFTLAYDLQLRLVVWRRLLSIYRVLLLRLLPGRRGAAFDLLNCVVNDETRDWFRREPLLKPSLAAARLALDPRATLLDWFDFENKMVSDTLFDIGQSQQKYPLRRCRRMMQYLCLRCGFSPFPFSNANLVSEIRRAYGSATLGRHPRLALLAQFSDWMVRAKPFAWTPNSQPWRDTGETDSLTDAELVALWFSREPGIFGGTLRAGLEMLTRQPYL